MGKAMPIGPWYFVSQVRAVRLQNNSAGRKYKRNQQRIRECNIGNYGPRVRMHLSSLKKMENMLQVTRNLIQKFKARLAVLDRDNARVQRQVEDLKNGDFGGGIAEKLEAIEHLYNIHMQEYVPEIKMYDRTVRETVLFFSDSKVSETYLGSNFTISEN
jgi:hypothetical protein